MPHATLAIVCVFVLSLFVYLFTAGDVDETHDGPSLPEDGDEVD